MIAILTTLVAQPDAGPQLLATATDHATKSLQADQRPLRADVCQDGEPPERVLLIEVFEDRQAYDAHRNGPLATGFAAALAPLVASVDEQVWGVLPPLAPSDAVASEEWERIE